MDQGIKKWIVRDASGRIVGPFTTEKVLYKIGRGELSGDEFIAHYPDGKWIAISQDPQFYDRLLDVVASDQDKPGAEQTPVFEFTNHTDNPTQLHTPVPEIVRESGTEPVSESIVEPLKQEPKVSPKSREKIKKFEDIELIDTRPEMMRAAWKKARLPLLVAAVGVVAAGLILNTGSQKDERVRLLAPQRGIANVATAVLKPRVQQAVGEFLKDTFKGYLRAQNEFVYTVERDPKNTESMALLCLTYLQLWPYSYQDSTDAKAISSVVFLSSTLDAGGPNAATCRVVDLMTRARYQEAKGLVEATLETRTNASQPPILFYYLKGVLLDGSTDHAASIDYLRSAQRLWPQWIAPFVAEAQAQTKLERYSEAVNIYRKILKANPGHSVSRIELGLLEYKHFNHEAEAEQLIKQGVDVEEAPKPILARGYAGLAELALKRGQHSRALDFAQKAYGLNPSNTLAKNLIVQLGGRNKLSSTKVKAQQLLFEGDQFAREGDCHSAQAHYKAAFEQDQRNAIAAIKAAQCLWKMSFSTEAIEWLNRAIQADPKQMDAYVTMADYQTQRFNFLAAARVLESGKRLNPQSPEIFRGYALVELRRGNPAGAINFGKMALKLYESDVETQILMAQASTAIKDYKMAYNYASKAIEIDVNNRKGQIAFAEALAGIQGLDIAVDYMLKLVNNYPLVNEYRIGLGKMLLADERYQQAEEIFRQVTKLDEKSKEAYVELAKVLRAQGESAEALNLLLKAAVLDPADAEPLFLAGTIYLDLKKAAEATVQFQRVLTINKLYPLVHYRLGRAALLMNDAREALNRAEAEKKANPNLADAYLLAAEAQTLLQQYSECAKEYQSAIKLRPQQASIYVRLAQCYRKGGNLDASMAMLNVAATKESGLADIYKEQGAIYESKGDLVHAIEAYQQYFVLDPEAPDREQIEGRISALQNRRSP